MLDEIDPDQFNEWLAVYQMEHEQDQANDLAATAEAAGANIRSRQ